MANKKGKTLGLLLEDKTYILSSNKTSDKKRKTLNKTADKKKKTLGRRLQDISKISPAKVTTPSVLQTNSQKAPQKLARVICVTSGKGGTGKSILTSNLAYCLAKAGQKVVVLDSDMGLANIHLLLGIAPEYDISNILNGEKTVHEVIVKTTFGFSFIPGGSGITELANLTDYQVDLLANAFTELESEADLLLIDTSAGIAPQTMRLLQAANEIVLVTTPEVTAITDAYAVIKVTFRENPHTLIGLVVNRARNLSEAKSVFTHLNTVSSKFLSKSIVNYGYVLEDKAVSESVAARQPVTLLKPKANASHCIAAIADRIISAGKVHKDRLKLTTGAFFARIQDNLKSMM